MYELVQLAEPGFDEEFILPASLTDADEDLTMAIGIDVVVVGVKTTDGVDGRIDINEVVAVVAHEGTGTVAATLCDDAVEEVGTAEEEVGGVVGSHGASRRGKHLAVVLALAR